MSQQVTDIDKSLVKKSQVASAAFMGLGQILFLKQYLRGAAFAFLKFL